MLLFMVDLWNVWWEMQECVTKTFKQLIIANGCSTEVCWFKMKIILMWLLNSWDQFIRLVCRRILWWRHASSKAETGLGLYRPWMVWKHLHRSRFPVLDSTPARTCPVIPIHLTTRLHDSQGQIEQTDLTVEVSQWAGVAALMLSILRHMSAIFFHQFLWAQASLHWERSQYLNDIACSDVASAITVLQQDHMQGLVEKQVKYTFNDCAGQSMPHFNHEHLFVAFLCTVFQNQHGSLQWKLRVTEYCYYCNPWFYTSPTCWFVDRGATHECLCTHIHITSRPLSPANLGIRKHLLH